MFYFCFFLQPSAASFAASIKFSIKMCRTQVSQLAAPKSLTTIVSTHSLGMLSERSSDSLPSFFFFFGKHTKTENYDNLPCETSCEKGPTLLTTRQKRNLILIISGNIASIFPAIPSPR